MTTETIAAISTPPGAGGIGILRISGPDALLIVQRLFVRPKHFAKPKNGHRSGAIFCSHRVYYGYIIEPNSRAIIDEVLAIYMKGPKSFTREDVVEIHSHSGFVVLNRLLSAVVDAGASLSGPGEFTKRAFLNGRIDLTQAEAIIDLINAPCETAARMASHQIAGGGRKVFERLSSNVTALQAKCEACIEFSEAIDIEDDFIDFQRDIGKSLLPEISELIQTQKDTAIFREGFLLAIAGVPNVGKSSLLNKLVDRETAIVSDVPGTTRDIVREYFSINGVPVVVCDTAGIHETQDPIECLGIEKARAHFRQADLVLLVLEANRELNCCEEKLIEEFKSFKTIAVINKDDLAQQTAIYEIERKLKNISYIRVSAKFGTGIPELKAHIFNDIVAGKQVVNSDLVTPNLRQRKLLEKAKQELQSLFIIENNVQALELISERLDNVRQILEELCGQRDQEDLYDHIFSQFCIGK